jgi:hypothetical protein
MTTGEITANLIAVLALVFSAVSLGWQIWTYFDTHSRRQAESKERIRAKALVILSGGSKSFQVETVTDGAVDVYMKHVRLVWMANGTEREINFFPTIGRGGLHGPQPDKCLSPHDSRWWYWPRDVTDPVAEIVKLPADKLWIDIHSELGEVARINGNTILPLVAEWQDAWVKHNNQNIT